MTDAAGIGPRPDRVGTFEDLLAEVQRLRVSAARGLGKPRLSLQDIATISGVPKSSLSNYLSGTTLIPADQLDAVVLAMGVTPIEAAAWAAAWERSMDHRLLQDRSRFETSTYPEPEPAAAPMETPGNPPPATEDRPGQPSTPSRRRRYVAVAALAGLLTAATVYHLTAADAPGAGGPSFAEPGASATPANSPQPGVPATRLRCVPVTGNWDERTDPRIRTARRGSTTAGLACKHGRGMQWTVINRHESTLPPAIGGYGNSDSCLPVTGDWDGDGTTTAGVACGGGSDHSLTWSVINGFAGSPSYPRFRFGDSDSCLPVTGDWDGDGTTTAGAACVEGREIRWHMSNTHSGTAAYPAFIFGTVAGCVPVTGDWDGDGTTGVGTACKSTRGLVWRLGNGRRGDPSAEFTFGDADRCRPVTGDWDGDGITGVGAVCQDGETLSWRLTNSFTGGDPSYPGFAFGADASYPVAGGWTGPAWPHG